MGFFKLGDAYKELTSAVGGKDTAIAGAKLFGKTLFNTGKFAFEEVVKYSERTSEKILKREDLTEEQRGRFEENHTKSKQLRIKNEISNIDDKITENKKIIENDDLSLEKRNEIRQENDSLERDKNKLIRE